MPRTTLRKPAIPDRLATHIA